MEQRNNTSALCHHTSYISKYIKHYPYNIKHLNDCEELVKILVTRCKKINKETLSKEVENE